MVGAIRKNQPVFTLHHSDYTRLHSNQLTKRYQLIAIIT
jgi:hypothetical protein